MYGTYILVFIQLNEKDMSMLEERIKRSGKFQEGGTSSSTKQSRIASAPTASSKTMKETKSMPTNLAKESAAIEKYDVISTCFSDYEGIIRD